MPARTTAIYAARRMVRAAIAATIIGTDRLRPAEAAQVSTATFDTLKFSETMREAGMPEAQAKALSQGLLEVTSALVTRQDLRAAVEELRGELRLETQSVRAEIQQLEQKLTIRLGGIVVVALGAFTALSRWIT